VYEGVIEFLQSEYFPGREFIPYTVTHNSGGASPSKLADLKDWWKKIGIKIVQKYNINAFFFQLVGVGILTYKWVNANTSVVCELAKDDNNHFHYKNKSYWLGFAFHKNEWGGGTISYDDIFNEQ